MAWKVSGQSIELCSCKLLCPCWLGPDEQPDQGWCSGVFAFDIREGESDGINLSGTRAAITGQWPGNFFGGDGTLRVYVDESASPDQRRELEAIFGGLKGGHLADLWSAVIAKRLPPQVAKIEIKWGDTPSLAVGEIGRATLQPVKDMAGKPARLEGAPALAGFQISSMDLASARGSRWADPEMRAWEGDSGTLHLFNWSA